MPHVRPPPMFVADAPALDLLNSVATPFGEPMEWLASGQDLVDWMDQAGLLPLDREGIRALEALPGELDAVAAQARALREWFRDFAKTHERRPLTSAALDALTPLNQVLARDKMYAQVMAVDPEDCLHLALRRRCLTPEALLAPLARAMAELVCDADFTHVKTCEGPTCTLMFLDKTKGHARRWCSMSICGNRAKQAAHRARRRSEGEGS